MTLAPHVEILSVAKRRKIKVKPGTARDICKALGITEAQRVESRKRLERMGLIRCA